MRAAGRTIAALAAALVLAGCSQEPTPAVEIGELPADVGAAIEVPSAPDILDFDTWPAGCDLLTDEVVQAMLPQAASIERESGDTKITLIGGSGTGNTDATATGAECRIWPRLPVGDLDTANGTEISVSVDIAGSVEAVDRNVSPADHEVVEIEGGDCFALTEDAITCRSDAGTIAFTVGVIMAYQSTDPEDPNTYTADGESVEFAVDVTSSSEEQAAIYQERSAFLMEHLTAPIAASILQRLAG